MTSVDSPCIAVCQLDAEQHYCTGCGRLTEEIALWSNASPAEQKQIVALATRRLATIEQRRVSTLTNSIQEPRKS